jgi:hypothetical protein
MTLKTITRLSSLAVMLAVVSAAAQQQLRLLPGAAPKVSPTAAAQPAKSKSQSQPQNKQKQEPCWKEVGIPENVFSERRSLEQSTRAEVERVCSDPALTDQQKRDKIRDIRKASRERMDALMTPGQRESLKQCQQGRAQAHPEGGGGMHAPTPHPSGPCAGIVH